MSDFVLIDVVEGTSYRKEEKKKKKKKRGQAKEKRNN